MSIVDNFICHQISVFDIMEFSESQIDSWRRRYKLGWFTGIYIFLEKIDILGYFESIGTS